MATRLAIASAVLILTLILSLFVYISLVTSPTPGLLDPAWNQGRIRRAEQMIDTIAAERGSMFAPSLTDVDQNTIKAVIAPLTNSDDLVMLASWAQSHFIAIWGDSSTVYETVFWESVSKLSTITGARTTRQLLYLQNILKRLWRYDGSAILNFEQFYRQQQLLNERN